MQTIDQTGGREGGAATSDYERERGKPMPNYTHGVVQANITVSLAVQAGTNYRVANELTFEFDDGLVLTPDISVLARRPVRWRREPARCREVPVMVVEIVPPSQGYSVAVEKIDAYFAHGVQSVWEVNPALEVVALHRPGEQRPHIVQQGEAIDPATGLTVRLEEVFA